MSQSQTIHRRCCIVHLPACLLALLSFSRLFNKQMFFLLQLLLHRCDILYVEDSQAWFILICVGGLVTMLLWGVYWNMNLKYSITKENKGEKWRNIVSINEVLWTISVVCQRYYFSLATFFRPHSLYSNVIAVECAEKKHPNVPCKMNSCTFLQSIKLQACQSARRHMIHLELSDNASISV